MEASELADTPFYYAIADEQAEIKASGVAVVYNKTIRALRGAPRGACTGVALASGKHPYTCESCYSLSTGKSSQLNRKLNCTSSLKHPREEAMQATKSGVVPNQASCRECSTVTLQSV